jgi:NADH dehydrogenase FAD-containing subunit
MVRNFFWCIQCTPLEKNLTALSGGTDFIKKDVTRLYRELLPHVSITIVEAGPALLGPFDKALQDYAQGLFKKRDIDVRLGTAVVGVEDFEGPGYRFPAKRALFSDGTKHEFGTMVWSAGLAPRTFTEELGDNIARHPRTHRILVDEFLRVKGHEGSIWAIGDAAINVRLGAQGIKRVGLQLPVGIGILISSLAFA